MWITLTATGRPSVQAREGRDDHLSRRSNVTAASSGTRGSASVSPTPTRSHLPGEAAVILFPRERMDLAPPVQRYLGREIGGRPIPKRPRRPPGSIPDSLSERSPMIPTHQSGATSTAENTFGGS